jgi:[ribosomal protein S18]-alanine N-acetyltransferase
MDEAGFRRRKEGMAGDAIRLRPARAADLDALVALEQAVFSGDRMAARQFRHHMDSPSGDLVVAVGSDLALLGYALLLRRRGSRVGRIYSIAVATQARGTGLGRRLLERLEAIARKHGLSEIRLEVRKDNAGAIGLYERAGYEIFVERAAYYEDGMDAWRMRKAWDG